MVNWRESLPRLVAPEAVITGHMLSGTRLVVGAEEYEDGDGAHGYMPGDQVRLASRSGRYISEEIYTIGAVEDGILILSGAALTASDQGRINFYTQDHVYDRGVVLRLAEIDEYENEWDPTITAYFNNPELAKRIWAYWGANPSDLWVIT